MESLLGDKPYMEPLCTLSSTGAETIKAEKPTSFHNFNIPGKSSNMNISVSRKSIRIFANRNLNPDFS